MPTIMPHSEMVRKAVEYISLEMREMRQNQGEPSAEAIYNLVEKACLKFDLSPNDASSLHNFLADFDFKKV